VLVAATDGIGAPFWLERAPSLLVFDRLPGAAGAAAIAEASIAAAVQAALERLDPYPARLVASGGLSERDGLLTLQATLAGRAVVRASLCEWTALGAALLAAGRRRPRRLRLRLERFSPARSRSREARRSFLLWKRAVKFLESSGF
jgi:glycerol kinase